MNNNMATFGEVRLITLRLREEIFSSKLKKLNEVNATVNNSRRIINLKQKKNFVKQQTAI